VVVGADRAIEEVALLKQYLLPAFCFFALTIHQNAKREPLQWPIPSKLCDTSRLLTGPGSQKMERMV